MNNFKTFKDYKENGRLSPNQKKKWKDMIEI